MDRGRDHVCFRVSWIVNILHHCVHINPSSFKQRPWAKRCMQAMKTHTANRFLQGFVVENPPELNWQIQSIISWTPSCMALNITDLTTLWGCGPISIAKRKRVCVKLNIALKDNVAFIYLTHPYMGDIDLKSWVAKTTKTHLCMALLWWIDV